MDAHEGLLRHAFRHALHFRGDIDHNVLVGVAHSVLLHEQLVDQNVNDVLQPHAVHRAGIDGVVLADPLPVVFVHGREFCHEQRGKLPGQEQSVDRRVEPARPCELDKASGRAGRQVEVSFVPPLLHEAFLVRVDQERVAHYVFLFSSFAQERQRRQAVEHVREFLRVLLRVAADSKVRHILQDLECCCISFHRLCRLGQP